MINAKLALHEVPPRWQTNPLKGNIFAARMVLQLPADSGRDCGMRREFPRIPSREGSAGSGPAGGFPSPGTRREH